MHYLLKGQIYVNYLGHFIFILLDIFSLSSIKHFINLAYMLPKNR